MFSNQLNLGYNTLTQIAIIQSESLSLSIL